MAATKKLALAPSMAESSAERVQAILKVAQRDNIPPLYSAAELVQAAILVLRAGEYPFEGIPAAIHKIAEAGCRSMQGEASRLQKQQASPVKALGKGRVLSK